MTVSTTTSRADYTGNGTTTAFAVPFYFLEDSHLTVLRTQISTGVITTLAITTNYTVSGSGNPAGGTITCLVAPTADQKISILRNVPLTQLNTYVPNDPFPAASHERALDKLTMEVQQLDEAIDRALTLPANTAAGTVSAALPSPVANKVIAWNANATGLQNFDASSLASVTAYGSQYTDLFSGNGVQTQFTLSQNPGALDNLLVTISGVTQRPTIDYTYAGSSVITFTSAPASGTDNIMVKYGSTVPQLSQVTTLTGDVTGTGLSSITTSIAAGAIVDADVNASAAIAPTKLAFTQAGTGASARTVDAKLKEYVSLADFGADKTGATDCRTAVVNAVAAAKAAGVPLFIPEGQYLINPSSSIVLQDVTILGAGVLDGSNSSLNNGSVFRIAATNPTIVPFKIRRGVTLDGISWYYNGQAATGSTRTTFAPTLEFDYTDGAVQFVYIRNCVAFNSWRWLNIAGAANAGAVGHIWITNNTICAISRGIEISLNREVIKIIGNTFTYGHWLDAAADHNTALGVAGYMRGSSGQAGAVAVYYQEGDGIWFTNNLVFGNKHGILMDANGLVQLCTLADNFFDQTLYPIAATGNGANCQFTKSQIVGNNFVSYSPIDNTLAGINVILGSAGNAATEHMVITGNTFSNAREHSIRVQGNNSRRVTITGNVFSGTATLQTSGSYYGVSCAGANSDLLISGNTTFQDNGSYAGGVEASAARSINLSGNDFRNCKEVVKITTATDVHMTGNRSTSTVGTYSDDITGVTGTVQASGNNFDKPNPAIGNRIRSDFSNATVNLRTAFQTSTTNGSTSMWSVPNGTATTAAMAWTNNPDPTNASYMQIGMFNNEAKLISSSLGSGTNYPLTITTGGSERARLDTNGVWMVNTTALGGLTGLGSFSYKAALNGDVMLGTLGRNVATSRSIGVFTTDDPASDDRARITFTTVAGGSSSNSRILFATNTYGVSGGERARIDESGNLIVTGPGGLGYGTGSGGTVTQATSRTTGVTLNKTNGSITLVSAAGTATWQSFTVTNSTVAVSDTVIVSQRSGTDLYQIFVTNVAAGSFRISFATTGGTTTEQPVFNFAVIKAVTA